MSSFWFPPVEKTTTISKSENKKTYNIKEASSSDSSSSSSESSSSSSSESSDSDSSSTSANTRKNHHTKVKSGDKKEELHAIYEDFMPEEDEKSLETSPEYFSSKLDSSLQEALQKLNKELEAFNNRKRQLQTSSESSNQSQPLQSSSSATLKISPSTLTSKSFKSIEESKECDRSSVLQESRKRRAAAKKELTKLRRERDQLKKKVVSLTKIGQNYQSKLNSFFSELSKEN